MFRKKNLWGYFLESILLSLIIGLIIPLIYLIRASITGEPKAGHEFLMGFVFSFTVSFCIYFFNVSLVRWLQAAENWWPSQLLRVSVSFLLTNLSAGLVMVLVFSVFSMLSAYEPHDTGSALFDSIVIALVVNTVCVVVMETVFFFRKWRHSLIESEQLRRQNIEIQYAALTSQINPHFLFNSLNALSSLIDSNNTRALKFTREFSKIYRYVLDSREKLVVTLNEELDFIHSFLYLQQIRFDKTLRFNTSVDMGCLDLCLPPLSLQLLVENAIKHNIISEEQPLEIEIIGNCGQIEVRNNYQPRPGSKGSHGIGLKNLEERYAHFTDRKPEFKVEKGYYIAIIPLIKDA